MHLSRAGCTAGLCSGRSSDLPFGVGHLLPLIPMFRFLHGFFKVCSTRLDLWGHRDTRFISSPTGLLFQDSSGRWHCTQGFAGVPEVVCEPLPGLQQRSRNFWSKFVHKSLHAACLKQVQFIYVNFPPRVLSGSESHNVGLLRLSVPVFLGALCLRGCAGVQTFLRGCDKLVPCAMPSVDNCRWDLKA